jgi:SAM-dependent methyltransferase
MKPERRLCLMTFGASAVLMNALMIEGARARDQIPEAPYVPTPNNVVEAMLRLANVGKNDVVYDLGCGDGRIVITAALKYGARGVGVDIDPRRIKESNENARKAGVTDRVKFLQQDLFKINLSEATVVTLYLLPEMNLRLRPKLLRELKPGARIVSHAFDLGDWKPKRVVRVPGPDRARTIYFWVTPARGKSRKATFASALQPNQVRRKSK